MMKFLPLELEEAVSASAFSQVAPIVPKASIKKSSAIVL